MSTRSRIFIDKVFSRTALVTTLISVIVVLFIGVGLYLRSRPLLQDHSLSSLLFSSEWKPMKGSFGFLPYIMGTLWVTIIALLIALPLSLLAAIYISEYAPLRLKRMILPFVDLLSGIPPVIFGVWGILFVVPFIKDHISSHFDGPTSGYSILAGGIVLAIMIFPLIISVLLEVFATVPRELKDASLSLGATQWQTVKFVLLRKSSTGIIAAVILALSRAFGETIAVLLVCGNVAKVPHSPLDPGYPLPALIANNYGEMLSVPKYDSALLFAALLLFVIIFLFNVTGRMILNRVERKIS